MAQITIRYFAAAAEAAGHDEESWELHEVSTLEELRSDLGAHYGEPMRKVLRSGSFLVNGVVRREGVIRSGNEGTQHTTVDVLPPFAGG